MGKSQKKRAMRRHNPMRVPDSHLPKGLASASTSSAKSGIILPIIQKMESTDGAERKWACVAVSSLIQNDPSTRRLLQGRNVVGVLIARLADLEEEVVIEATGALRNLCIDGGYDICAEMYNKNIMAPLKTFTPKISETLSQYLEAPKTAPQNAQKLVYEFADNVITILWCLSETSNKALNAINDCELTPFLMSFLAAREHLPLQTVTSAAQCLYVLTDDNFTVSRDVRVNAEYLACLLAIVRSEQTPVVDEKSRALTTDERTVTLSVLAAGILRNVGPIPPPAAASFLDIDKDIVLPLLQPVISSIALPELANLAQGWIDHELLQPEVDPSKVKDLPVTDHKSPSQLELEKLERKLRTVQLSLEILTGVCATLPDPEIEKPKEKAEGDDNEEDNDIDIGEEDIADVEMSVDKTSKEVSNSSFLPTLVEPLLALIQPTQLSFPPFGAPSPHPPTTSALSAIHVSALECLNNIFLSLSTSPNASVSADVQAGRKIWDAVWTALGVVGTQYGLGQERRKEMWEIAVGVLWGIGNVWKGSLLPNEERVQVLIQLCGSSEDPALRVKCIGTLECLAQPPEFVASNLVIANYLISLLPEGNTPSSVGTEPLLQVISALIDIYSDENMPYDINFRQGGFLKRLSDAVEGTKKAVKAIDKRKEGGRELRRRGEEMRDNLVDFIQYRKDLRL